MTWRHYLFLLGVIYKEMGGQWPLLLAVLWLAPIVLQVGINCPYLQMKGKQPSSDCSLPLLLQTAAL